MLSRRTRPIALMVLALSACAQAQTPKLRVACVGDSITQGVGAKVSYPSQLAKLLGDGYEVRNFGVSARTLLSRGDNPWIKERKCAEALAFNPNLVVIMLGTNDSKPHNWAHKAEFKADYAALIDKFAALEAKPKVYACLPVPAYPENYGIRDSVIAGEICPLIVEVAKDKGAETIDLHTPLVGLAKCFPDKVHPNDEGARGMATMVAAALTTPVNPANNALVPVSKLENDWYDWFKRHEAIVKLVKDGAKPEVVTIGDSITHLWGGEPKDRANGPKAWAELFGERPVLNLGFGWDRIQNVLWRLDHGEFDGLRPKAVVLHIGTNNLTAHNARENTPAEIAEGIRAIICRVRLRAPYTQIILMGVLPRGGAATNGFRPKIKAINALLAPLGELQGITYYDIADKLLDPDGTLPKSIMGDGTHPTEEGYRRWAAAIKPKLEELLGK